MNIVCIFLCILIFYILFSDKIVFYLEKMTAVTGYNDDFPFIAKKEDISDISVIMSNFDDLILYKQEGFPDSNTISTKFTKYPYYEKFPFDISDILLKYIKSKMVGVFKSDKIVIVKAPYDVYYEGTDLITNNFNSFRRYILSIDIADNTHFFVRTYLFYVNLESSQVNNFPNVSVLSVIHNRNDSDAGTLFYKYDTANNTPKYNEYS
jgi:hypothetical protein